MPGRGLRGSDRETPQGNDPFPTQSCIAPDANGPAYATHSDGGAISTVQIIPHDHADFVTQVADALPFDPRPIHVPDRHHRRWLDRMDGPEPLVNLICAFVAAALLAAGFGCFIWLAIKHL